MRSTAIATRGARSGDRRAAWQRYSVLRTVSANSLPRVPRSCMGAHMEHFDNVSMGAPVRGSDLYTTRICERILLLRSPPQPNNVRCAGILRSPSAPHLHILLRASAAFGFSSPMLFKGCFNFAAHSAIKVPGAQRGNPSPARADDNANLTRPGFPALNQASNGIPQFFCFDVSGFVGHPFSRRARCGKVREVTLPDMGTGTECSVLPIAIRKSGAALSREICISFYPEQGCCLCGAKVSYTQPLTGTRNCSRKPNNEAKAVAT